MGIEKMGIDAPGAEDDPVEAPFDGLAQMAQIRRLDLDESNLRSIIWATGFGPRFDYLDGALLDDDGRPRQHDGKCSVAGLYCVGFMWMRRRVSGLVAGVDRDAEHVVGLIAASNGA
jgi:putative flavoprotein involved in K+ transport